MAETVELGLEKLLPVFEHLKLSKLYTTEEVSDCIRRCRRYEYSIAKQSKSPKDFLLYINYIIKFLHEIDIRRRTKKFFGHYDDIEKILKNKGAKLHRICSERFKNEEFHRKEIKFLLQMKLHGHCSSAYTRFLQWHGTNPLLHDEVGRFEFFCNKSAENARTILHSALRRFSKNPVLWLTLFEIELEYVKYVKNRIEFLKKQSTNSNHTEKRRKDKTDPEPTIDVAVADSVLELKLAEIVYSQAMKALPDNLKPEFILKAWKLVHGACEIVTNNEFVETLREAANKLP